MELDNTNYTEVTLDETVLKQLGYEVEYKEDWIIDLTKLISFKKNGEDVKDIVIPATYSYNGKNYKITKIGKYAFTDCKSLKSVVIPDSIDYIGNWGFN